MKSLADDKAILFEKIACPATLEGIESVSHLVSKCSKPIEKSFKEYEVFNFGITRPNSQDFDLEFDIHHNHGKNEFSNGVFGGLIALVSHIKCLRTTSLIYPSLPILPGLMWSLMLNCRSRRRS